MNAIPLVLLALACLFLGAFFHENDMAENCAREGNAHAWFNEIKCEASK